MSDPVKQYLASIGARGGKAGTGKAKARTKAQARAAAKARWDRARAVRQNSELNKPGQHNKHADHGGESKACLKCETASRDL